MSRLVWGGASLVMASAMLLTPALATCTPAAPNSDLEAFIRDPDGWIATHGRTPDLGAASFAIAATAVNTASPTFGKALAAMLGAASSDQGRTIGHALSGLEGSCTDDKDPADVADKKYISLNILPNLLSNLSANVAFGEAGGPQTASTGGGGGGGGAGSGPVGADLPTGAANNGAVNDGSTSTPTTGDPISQLGTGAVGATGTLFGTNAQVTSATILETPGGTGSGSVSASQ